MALTDDEIKVLETLVDHYGFVNDWQVDHWRNYHLIIEAALDDFTAGQNSEEGIRVAKEIKNLNKIYSEDKQRLTNESDQLFSIARDLQHIDGQDNEDKLFLVKRLLNDGLKVTEDIIPLLKEKANKITSINAKKTVGRPRNTAIYRWIDYLVEELGSINRAVAYAANFPVLKPKNADTLKREYRKYRKAKGEG